jgi:hypothetical protein
MTCKMTVRKFGGPVGWSKANSLKVYFNLTPVITSYHLRNAQLQTLKITIEYGYPNNVFGGTSIIEF